MTTQELVSILFMLKITAKCFQVWYLQFFEYTLSLGNKSLFSSGSSSRGFFLVYVT